LKYFIHSIAGEGLPPKPNSCANIYIHFSHFLNVLRFVI